MDYIRNTKLGALLSLGLSLFVVGCKSSDGEVPFTDKPMAMGLSYTDNAEGSVESIYNNIVSALEANSAIGIVAEVNHQQNAQNVGLDLNPTRVVLFGNPKLGTPLMQANQQAGLDLPQKMLVYENDLGQTYAAFNSAQYIASRHGVDTVSTLPTIEMALTNLAKNATNGTVVTSDKNTVALNEGVVSMESANSFSETYEKLRSAIAGNSNLKIVAELDHQQNAKSVGLELNPTKLIVFGNPNLGTPLMQAEQTIAIDLPQKMLVYENESGKVMVAYNDPYYLAKRHGVTGEDKVLKQIQTALNNLATGATQQ